MGFSVTPSKPDRFQLGADTNDFVRLKEHFHGHTQSADNLLALSELPPNLRQFTHRNWTPNSGRNINLDSYIKVVKEAIIGKSGNSIIYPNLTNNKQKALKEVISKAGRNLIILLLIKADVGSVVEWLKRQTRNQHGLGSKATRAILLCPWERHFTAHSPAWWS